MKIVYKTWLAIAEKQVNSSNWGWTVVSPQGKIMGHFASSLKTNRGKTFESKMMTFGNYVLQREVEFHLKNRLPSGWQNVYGQEKRNPHINKILDNMRKFTKMTIAYFKEQAK